MRNIFTTKKKRALICAALIAMPVLLGFKTVDPVEENPVENSADDSTAENPADDTAAENPADDTAAEKSDADDTAEKNSDADDSAAKFFEAPPDTPSVDDRTLAYMARFDGKTIVDITFEGASEITLPSAKNAVLSHVGDDFDSRVALRDLNAIKNIGFFYDAYMTFSEIPEGLLVTYHILENPVLRRVEFEGNTVYSEDELQKLVTVRRNAIINQNTLHDNFRAIEEKYHEDGYIFMRLFDFYDSLEGVLTIRINEGVLEGYKIKGNTKTKDYVIMREMRQKVGEPFNAKLMRRSMERLYNLGFFEDVNIKRLAGVEPNAVVIEIEVKEKRTGTFGIGAGYSTREGLIGSIGVADTNFRGTGDAVSLSFETSADEEDAHGFAFSYRRPWLDSHETAGVFRIFNRTYQYYDYDTDGDLKERYMRKGKGGEITLSRPMSEYSTNFVSLKQRTDEYIRHVSDGKSGDRSGVSGESWRRENFGTTRSIGVQHVTDTRDNIYNPTTGGRVSIGGEFAGFIGGDFDFQKYTIEHQQFWPAGHAQVWGAKAAYGVGYGDLTEFNQFRVGGQSSLRGYRDDQFRGSHMTLWTLEYRFPLAKSVQGILFTDWGGAWGSGFLPKGKDIYGSGGMGIALNTPLGPLRLDYGRGSQGGRFHFSVGGGF